MAIQRVWKAHGLQPHRLETFKLSRDKQFGTGNAQIRPSMSPKSRRVHAMSFG